MSGDADAVLELVVGAVARAFQVKPGEVGVDADLFDSHGFTVRHRVLDSLELVEVVSAVEEAVGVDLEVLLQAGGSLTLRQVAEFVAGEGAADRAARPVAGERPVDGSGPTAVTAEET